MLQLLHKHRHRILIIAAVFALFLAHALGLFNLALDIRAGQNIGQLSTNTGGLMLSHALGSPDVLVLIAIGLALSALLPVLSPMLASLLTFATMLPVFYMGYQLPATPRVVPMEYALLTILVLFVVNVLLSYFTETRRKQNLINAFGQYVPPQLVAAINRDPDGFSLQGESRNLTITFVDIFDFTAISEHLTPRELASFLNTLFTPLTEVIYKHNGTVDKYMGDAIMCFWGAPLRDERHAANALSAALEMQELLGRLRPAFKARGWPDVHIGIGLNTGTVSVGNMGSRYRMAYTVIGDAVNLAARYQALTRIYNAEIIVGETTRKAVGIGHFRELGLVAVKGKSRPARIYEPVSPGADPESTLVENLRRHNEALKCYYHRDWARARKLFEGLRANRPQDPIYPFYLERIAEYRTNPPPQSWRGEVRFTVK